MENNHTGSRLEQKPANKKKKKGWKSWLLRFTVIAIVLAFLAILAGGSLFFYYARNAPEIKEDKLVDSLSSTIYTAEGAVAVELGAEKREEISPNEVPQLLKDAITSIEDKRFYHHRGIDPIRIVGAFVSNLRNSGNLQGGSTLTQQLIKLSFFSTEEKDQTLRRKAQEAWMSLQLEKKKSKDQIMTYYINKVFMANNIYGMETASKMYFGKTLSEISLAQTALLAGMPQAPMDYDPYAHPEQAQARRDLVLKSMYNDGKVSKEQYNEALQTPVTDGLIELDQGNTWKEIDNYLKQVIEEVEQKTGKNVYTDGLDIYTNLNMDAQQYLYNLTNTGDAIAYPNAEFQVASTLMDVKTGKVLAQIGGRNIPDDVQLGNNIAVTGKRDVGSTMKPIAAYAPAIEYLNEPTAQIIRDGQHTYKGTTIPVKNYDNLYRGNLTMREAIIDSRNVTAVKTLENVGLDKSSEFLGKLGIDMEMYYANAISGNLSSLQLASAYAAFANGGTYYKPYYVDRVVYADGTEQKFEPEGTEAMKDSTAYMITDMLKDVIRRGTGTAAQIPDVIQAGKTGTSNYSDDDLAKVTSNPVGEPDISFVGYTPDYVMSVWTGYDDYFHGIAPTDQKIAALYYKAMMTHLLNGKEQKDWEQPSSVVKRGKELYVKGFVTQYQGNYSNDNSETTYSSTTRSSSSAANYQPAPAAPQSSSSSAPAVDPEPEVPASSAPPVVPTSPSGNHNDGNDDSNEPNVSGSVSQE